MKNKQTETSHFCARIVFFVAEGWASEYPDVKNYKWRLNPVWDRMLYSCTHIATVGTKGLSLTHIISRKSAQFLADRTNGRAIATLLRLSSVVVCRRLWRYVLWLNGAS